MLKNAKSVNLTSLSNNLTSDYRKMCRTFAAKKNKKISINHQKSQIMKKMILTLVAALAISGSAKAEDSGKAIAKGYNRVSVMYSAAFATPFSGGGKDGVRTHHGVGVSYARGIAFCRSLPLYAEVGASWQYFPVSSGDSWDNPFAEGLEMMRISVPVNITYRFALGKNGNFKISPSTGLNFGFNAISKVDYNYWHMVGGTGYGFDTDGKVFQLGWLAGVNFSYKGFNIGLAYCLDLMPMFDTTYGVNSYGQPYPFKVNIDNLQLSLGYEF
jgi:hypothetical protein